MWIINLLMKIGEVIRRMFSRDRLNTVTGEQVTLSTEMIQAIEKWYLMITGKAPWVNLTDDDGVKSLHLESQICREFTNVALSEMDTHIENEALNEIYQKALGTLNENMQMGLALGTFVIKPIGSTGGWEYIPADRIIPLEFASDGSLRRCAFVQVKPIGDYDVYYRLEIHELSPEGLRIRNRAFKGTKGEFGNEISITAVQEWADLAPDVLYPGMDRMDFGYYRNPLPNKIDGSMTGVSIYADAEDLIRKADIQFGRLDWEYSSGERLVFADYTALKKVQSGSGYKWKAPKGKDKMFVGVDGAENMWQEHSPEIRDESFINGLNEYKRQIEHAVSLSYGDLSKGDEVVEKTAQEIKASQNRKYNQVNAIQNNLKQCLEGFAEALAFYAAMYTQDIGFECTFHDSIKTDEETERAQDRIDVQMGVMSKIEYRQKWYGEDEKTAAQKIADVTAALMGQSGGEMS